MHFYFDIIGFYLYEINKPLVGKDSNTYVMYIRASLKALYKEKGVQVLLNVSQIELGSQSIFDNH